jgi:hypothetical protein
VDEGGVAEPLLFDPDSNINMDPFGPINGTGNRVTESEAAVDPTTTAPTVAPVVIESPETTGDEAQGSSKSLWMWVGLVACVLIILVVLLVLATRGGGGRSAPSPNQFRDLI